ncbi:aspartate aminotransferase family protein [Litorimonas sp. WD9-15]|uniref:aspartate aminotransferase family protein n=1 Tax=Litorimonas sp. WD9-15 TaxID=3418716 RepID=UPI003CFC3EC4
MAANNHIYDCYRPPAQEFVRGEGPYLYTEDGDKYLDFIAGIAVSGLGHAHPKLVEVLNAQASKLWHLSNMFRVEGAERLAERYCDHLGWAGKVFFTNSGAEAVECAMKTARRYQHDSGHPERVDIISFSGAFHGRTMSTVTAGGNPKYMKGFGPAIPGFINLEFGDHEALKEAISETTAAILVEPVQGEGGLRPLPPECLRGLRALCDEHGLMLIYDEVQCGAGRTGKLFAHQWVEGGHPDIMAAAKGIGGGYPLGACFATAEAAQYMVPGTHGSTYGGGPMAIAVGNAALDLMEEEEFLDNVVKVSNFLKQQFEGLKDEFPDMIEELRGKGLLMGLQMKVPNVDVKVKALDHNLLVGTAGDNVLRMAPPLIITEDHVREAIDALRKTLIDVKAAG